MQRFSPQLHIMRHVTSVVGENANRGAPPAAEHKQASREGILLQLLLAQSGQRVDALSFSRCCAKKEICAVHGYAESPENWTLRFQLRRVGRRVYSPVELRIT